LAKGGGEVRLSIAVTIGHVPAIVSPLLKTKKLPDGLPQSTSRTEIRKSFVRA
jgi:hypothetical protein